MPTVEDERVSQEALAGVHDPARVPLGQLLIQGGFLTQAQLDDALYEGSRTGERLGEVVVRRGLASEDDVARLLAQQWDLEYVERSAIWFDGDALARISREDAQRLEALPTRVEGGRVVVAVAEPTEQRLAALRDVIGEETVMVVVPKSALEAGLRSDLLRSGREQAARADEPANEPVPEPEFEPPPAPVPFAPEPAAAPEPEPEPEPELRPVALAAVADLPVRRPDFDDSGSDAVSMLADEARAVAERLATQAAAVRAEQHDLRVRSEQYESRIKELEQSFGDLEQRLEARTEQLNRVRGQLSDLLSSFDG
jgi:hypothetical protein